MTTISTVPVFGGLRSPGSTPKPKPKIMSETLHGKRVAILVANGFEQSELQEPRKALEAAGARTDIVSPESGDVRGWQQPDWGDSFPVDVSLGKAEAGQYDALVLPGGVMNPDVLRANDEALDFVRAFFTADKPVGCICHGAWTLVEAGVVADRRMTSYHSIRTDVENAGAQWTDEEVVHDGNLVTSRNPDDLPAFCKKLVALIAANGAA